MVAGTQKSPRRTQYKKTAKGRDYSLSSDGMRIVAKIVAMGYLFGAHHFDSCVDNARQDGAISAAGEVGEVV